MASARSITLADVQGFLQPRPIDAHKGLFGKILVVGGDYGMPGAVRLVGEAALRIGAGLVTVVTHPAHIAAVVSARPELLCYGTDESLKNVSQLLAQATLIVLGSGLGQSAWSQQLFAAVMASNLPKVIDADGLNWLARMPNLSPSSNWILTPHPGEAARMLGTQTKEIQHNRNAALVELQQRYGGLIVLKGAGTLLMNDDHEPVQCLAGNPAMATAGMGDILSGMIAGLVGQGLSLWQAAQAGVVMHATAADRVVAKQGSRGLLALDLLPELTTL